MAMDALSKFSSAVMKTAEDGRKYELDKVRRAEKERLETAILEIKNSAKSRVRIEHEKLKRENELEISALTHKVRSDIAERRDKMFEEIFSEVEKNIAEYIKSPRYAEDLIKSFNEAISQMGDGETVCTALPRDIEILKTENGEILYKEAQLHIIGGFCLQNRESRLYIDMTIKSRMDGQKKNFYRTSGLVLG